MHNYAYILILLITNKTNVIRIFQSFVHRIELGLNNLSRYIGPGYKKDPNLKPTISHWRNHRERTVSVF